MWSGSKLTVFYPYEIKYRLQKIAPEKKLADFQKNFQNHLVISKKCCTFAPDFAPNPVESIVWLPCGAFFYRAERTVAVMNIRN